MIQLDKVYNLTPPPMVMHCTYAAESISEIVPRDVPRVVARVAYLWPKKGRCGTTEQPA